VVRRHPLLTLVIIKVKVFKVVQTQLANSSAKGQLIAMLQKTAQGTNFLTFLLRVMVAFSIDTLKGFLLELCLNSNVLFEGPKQITYYFANEVRKKVLGEIYAVLEEEFEAAKAVFFDSSASVHLLLAYAQIHTYLLSVRDIARLSVKQEESQPGFAFSKLYQEIFKALRFA